MSYEYRTWEKVGLWVSVILLSIGLGLYMGQLLPIPLPGIHPPHYRTLTIINSTTVTIPINVTKTTTYTTTTTVGGKIVTATMTTTYVETTTTTAIENHTTTVVLPVTTTVNHTTTVTSTSYVGYTTTFTATIIENASQLPPLNMSDPGSILAYIKADFGLGMAGIANLSLPLGYCIGTMWLLPNASVVWLGAWFIPQNIAQKMMNNYAAVYTFPKTGIKEYVPYVSPSLAVLNYAGNTYGTFGADTYLININYPGNGYIIGLYGSNIVGSLPPWGLTVSPGTYQLLSNGTYIMALVNSSIPTLMQLVLNPPGLCLIQVIRVKPGTPDSYILNMTYLGAQYIAWVVSEAIFGKPAPCYVPWAWTYGYVVYRINITEPIDSTWDYYCGPKGIWLPMKP